MTKISGQPSRRLALGDGAEANLGLVQPTSRDARRQRIEVAPRWSGGLRPRASRARSRVPGPASLPQVRCRGWARLATQAIGLEHRRPNSDDDLERDVGGLTPDTAPMPIQQQAPPR